MGVEVFVTAAELAAEAAEATAAGAEVAAALAAVGTAAALSPAIVLGAGIAGAILGEQLWQKYGLNGNPPALLPPVSGGQANTSYRVYQSYKLFNQPRNSNPYPTPIPGPIYGYQYDQQGDSRAYFISAANNSKNFTIDAPADAFEEFPTITSIERLDGLPDPGSLPRNFQDRPPQEFPIVVPSEITLPGDPTPTPINPEVYPSPAVEPTSDPDQKREPGVIVKIPETGTQIQVTPDGGFKTRYVPGPGSPNVAEQPPAPPTTKKVATDPCPCPENKTDLTEVLCRVKALEKGLLVGDYVYTPHVFDLGNGGEIPDLPDEFFSLRIQVTDSSQPIKKERPSGSSRTVWYAGWFYFRFDNSSSLRTPINFADSQFLAPEQANGFGVSISYGGTCTCTAVTRKRKDYVDAC